MDLHSYQSNTSRTQNINGVYICVAFRTRKHKSFDIVLVAVVAIDGAKPETQFVKTPFSDPSTNLTEPHDQLLPQMHFG